MKLPEFGDLLSAVIWLLLGYLFCFFVMDNGIAFAYGLLPLFTNGSGF